MKRFIKYPFALALLSLGTVVQNTEARRYIWFDEPFLDNSWVDDLMDFQRQSVELFRQHAAEYGPSKEDREALKVAREKLAKIKYTITEDDQKVTIQFTGFESLDKKDIKIVKKEDGLIGTIAAKEGKIEFLIAPQAVQLSRRVEITKESKKEDKDKKEKTEQVSFSSSLASNLDYFKNLVDISTAKVESVKDNTLTLVIEKQKEEILPIP